MPVSAKSLHVLRVYGRLPPLPGGMEKHIAELTAAQRKLGVRVTSIFNVGSSVGEALCVFDGYELHRLRPTMLRDLLFYSAAAMRHREISGNEVRVVHAHGGWSAFLFARILAHAVGARSVAASLHAFIPHTARRYQFALKVCNPIFATGLNEVRYLESVTGRKIYHLPSAPADLFFEKPRLVKDFTDVIVVANLLPVKNVALVLLCAAQRPFLRFSIYGDGPERLQLEAMRHAWNLNNVKFYGIRPAQELHSAMHGARVFLSTSLSEGSPTAALEAMACGLPVILTPSNNYSNIITSGKNGHLTDGWDVADILDAVDACLINEGLRQKMSIEARYVAMQHRWQVKAEFVTNAMLEAVQ